MTNTKSRTGIILATFVVSALALPGPAGAVTIRETPRGPVADTGIPGRWFLVIQTEDGLAPEAGPFPLKSDCERVADEVVRDVRAEHGAAMAAKTRRRARCERR